jgi:hypothetical protein
MSISAKGVINRQCIGSSCGFGQGVAKAAGQSVIVNSRNLGARGEMSQGFSETATNKMHDKVKLKRLMIHAQTETYEKNPMMQRRLKQKIATKAGELYGIDCKKIMGHEYRAKPSSNYGGSKNSFGPTGVEKTRFGASLQQKIRRT